MAVPSQHYSPSVASKNECSKKPALLEKVFFAASVPLPTSLCGFELAQEGMHGVRITEGAGWEGSCGDRLVQPSAEGSALVWVINCNSWALYGRRLIQLKTEVCWVPSLVLKTGQDCIACAHLCFWNRKGGVREEK